MVNADVPHDPAKALEYKESGNKCFQAGDYVQAEALYSKAINHDPSNPLLYTNRSMALLKLHLYPRVILDTRHAISLLPHNMKAYFQLAQAQIALGDPSSALTSAKKAHEFCVEECMSGGKGASSIGPITELVLRAKKEDWERKVPDWCVDDITFSVMLDPTKTGQSYDRSSIMEHLRRSPTDPLTREPLQVSDLRPNLALRAACEEFLQENGWAVDW
ncbi:U-box-domain-containing protein [Cadophora sp. DSE1049]|nr:U-box-domain-containing protein [Cadophora sp. DSE1049]